MKKIKMIITEKELSGFLKLETEGKIKFLSYAERPNEFVDGDTRIAHIEFCKLEGDNK